MKYIKSILFSLCVFGAALGYVHSCANKVAPIVKVEYVTDSIKIVELENVLQLTRDSLNAYKNSISEDEFILRYKFERIKYYHELAGKGNNSKFLRGWIGRVINE